MHTVHMYASWIGFLDGLERIVHITDGRPMSDPIIVHFNARKRRTHSYISKNVAFVSIDVHMHTNYTIITSQPFHNLANFAR